ncbi:aconitase X [Candidatus Pyrohabitans sp.]
MYLTREEERLLDGENGEALRRAMRILLTLGEMNNAERLIPITSAQISGVSYKTIGDAGLEFLQDLAKDGARVMVFTTLNPAGVDILAVELGFPEEFIKKQREILSAYGSMGVIASCTCTPYYVGNLPRFGEHIAWAESSSVIYANSVIGARTNRESAISALAAALVGRVPEYGLHLSEKRRGSFRVEIKAELKSSTDYAALGYYVGKNYSGIPVFTGASPQGEDLKALGAALATGAISMFHFAGATPEYREEKLEKVEVDEEELREAWENLNTCDEPEVITIGCPHASLREVLEVVRLNPRREVWIFTSRQVKELAERYIKNENIKIIADTCMVVSPLEELGIRCIGVNSAKAAFYSANLSGISVRFDSLENLLRAE